MLAMTHPTPPAAIRVLDRKATDNLFGLALGLTAADEPKTPFGSNRKARRAARSHLPKPVKSRLRAAKLAPAWPPSARPR